MFGASRKARGVPQEPFLKSLKLRACYPYTTQTIFLRTLRLSKPLLLFSFAQPRMFQFEQELHRWLSIH